MAAVNSTPDWQHPLETEEFILLPSYGERNLYFLVPRNARLAEKADRTPDFLLEFVSDRNDLPEESLYANLNLGLSREVDTENAYRFLAEHKPCATLVPASFTTRTCCYFESGGVHKAQAFAWEECERARIHDRIPQELARLLYGALANGSLSVARAALECDLAAFLPREEATVSFETERLLAALSELVSGGSVPFRRMTSFLTETRPDLIAVAGERPHHSSRERALAIAGRLLHFLGEPVPCPRISDGPHLRWRTPVGERLAKHIVWDLRTPLLAAIPVMLSFDPLTPILKQGGRDAVTRFTRVPPMPADRLTRRVRVAANLVPNLRTHVVIEVVLRVGAAYSRSGLTTSQSIPLVASGQSKEVELKFRRSTPQPYSVRVRAVSERGVLDSPWVEEDSDYLFLDNNRLPGAPVTIRAMPQLLLQAQITVAVVSPDLDGMGQSCAALQAILQEDEPAATFLLEGPLDGAHLLITARDPAVPENLVTLTLPCRPVSLDLPAFTQYGVQTVGVTVRFRGGAQAAQIEFLPESGEDEPIVLRFTAASPAGEFRYDAPNLFRHRFRFRWTPEEDGSPPAWSDYRSPDEPLILQAP